MCDIYRYVCDCLCTYVGMPQADIKCLPLSLCNSFWGHTLLEKPKFIFLAIVADQQTVAFAYLCYNSAGLEMQTTSPGFFLLFHGDPNLGSHTCPEIISTILTTLWLILMDLLYNTKILVSPKILMTSKNWLISDYFGFCLYSFPPISKPSDCYIKTK